MIELKSRPAISIKRVSYVRDFTVLNRNLFDAPVSKSPGERRSSVLISNLNNWSIFGEKVIKKHLEKGHISNIFPRGKRGQASPRPPLLLTPHVSILIFPV